MEGAQEKTKEVKYRDVPNFPGYRVGDDGSVWTCRIRGGGRVGVGEKWFKMRPVRRGRDKRLSISLRPSHRQIYLSRLVLLAFVGPCPENMEACHNDGNMDNNAIQNLRWDTKVNNNADKLIHGTHNKGSRHGMAKLTEESVRSIRENHAQGASKYSLAKQHGVSFATITFIVRRVTWLHVV